MANSPVLPKMPETCSALHLRRNKAATRAICSALNRAPLRLRLRRAVA